MCWSGKMKKVMALSEILEPQFVEWFLIEENNIGEIRSQFPCIRGCSL